MVPEWARGLTSALDEKMGFELVEIGPDRIAGKMPVEGNTQPVGLWHGGASAVLVETLGSMGTWVHSREDGRVPVGVDINVTHHRPVTKGWVHGVGTPLSIGRTVACWSVTITDDAGKLVATGRLTCQMVKPRM